MLTILLLSLLGATAASAGCQHGTCLNAATVGGNAGLEEWRGRPYSSGRKLQQWSSFGGCGNKLLTVVHGSNGQPADLNDLINDMAAPITKVQFWTVGDFNVTPDYSQVQFINLTDPAACINGLTTVRSALVIYDDGSIPSLAPLAALRSVQGAFYVYGARGNASLTTLAGLENLEMVDALNLAHTRLTSLTALTKLRLVQSELVIWDNQELVGLQGLQKVSYLYHMLWLDSNNLISDLRGLEGLTYVSEDLVIRNMPNLTSLDGLQGLIKVEKGEFSLVRNPKLTTTRHLAGNFTTLGFSLIVLDNPLLADLSGFGRATSMGGDLQLNNLPALTSLAGLSNLTSVGLNLVLSRLSALTALEGLDNIRSVGTLLSVSHNPKLQSLKGLGSLQSIGQDLVIRSNPALTTLADLPASLKSIGAFRGGDIFIEDNPSLADLAGLDAPGIPVFGNVTVTGSSAALPAAQVDALRSKANPVLVTVELLRGGPLGSPAPAAAPAAGK